MAKKKPARKKKSAKTRSQEEARAAREKIAGQKETRSAQENPVPPADEISNSVSARSNGGLGPGSGGQSGDVQGLSGREVADSESVEELAEEGQDYEAGIVSGVENAPDADQGEVRTREVPENDVPEEYLDEQWSRSSGFPSVARRSTSRI